MVLLPGSFVQQLLELCRGFSGGIKVRKIKQFSLWKRQPLAVRYIGVVEQAGLYLVMLFMRVMRDGVFSARRAKQLEQRSFLFAWQCFEQTSEILFGSHANLERAIRIRFHHLFDELLTDVILEHHDNLGVHAATVLIRQLLQLIAQTSRQTNNKFLHDCRSTAGIKS